MSASSLAMGNMLGSTISGISNPATTVGAGTAAPSSTASTTGTSSLDSILTGLLTSGAGVYGAQNASQAQTDAISAAMGTQNSALAGVQNTFGTQSTIGNGAMTALGSVLGTNGNAPDPSVFLNQPGYQFAVNQGTQAINRQAAATGNLYTPNTLDSVGGYVAGTASQNYNNYVQQLLSTAGLGSSANTANANAQLQTGSNISQLQQNAGVASASGVTGAVGAGLNGLNSSSSGVAGIISALGKALGGSGSSSTANSSGLGAGTIGAINGTSGSGASPGLAQLAQLLGAGGSLANILGGSSASTAPAGTNPGAAGGLSSSDLQSLLSQLSGMSNPSQLFGSTPSTGVDASGNPIVDLSGLQSATDPSSVFGTGSGATTGYNFSDPTQNP